MRHDTFWEIYRVLHSIDKSRINNDKNYKLRPLKNILKNHFFKFFVPQQALNYDESIVKYFSRHSCKQFVRGKPIRFGFKTWYIIYLRGI